MDHQTKSSTLFRVLLFIFCIGLLRRFELHSPCATVRRRRRSTDNKRTLRQQSCRVSDGSPDKKQYTFPCAAFVFYIGLLRYMLCNAVCYGNLLPTNLCRFCALSVLLLTSPAFCVNINQETPLSVSVHLERAFNRCSGRGIFYVALIANRNARTTESNAMIANLNTLRINLPLVCIRHWDCWSVSLRSVERVHTFFICCYCKVSARYR